MNAPTEKKAIKIDSAITGFEVIKDSKEIAKAAPVRDLVTMNEYVKRPTNLSAQVYKIKPPSYDQSFYLTISDIILNEGTDNEERRPFEVFINTKNVDSLQWMSALTILISAIFRKGGDYHFMINELKEVIDPKGGWMGRSIAGHNGFIPSVIAEIANAIDHHVNIFCGQQKEEEALDEHQSKFIADKVKAHLELIGKTSQEDSSEVDDGIIDMKLPQASDCPKCNAKNAVIRMDNCPVCTNCGDSKCG